MTISGEFWVQLANGDEHVAPNQFTIIGMQSVLKAAFQEIKKTWYVGLCAHNPADTLALSNVNEPVIGTAGYQRQELALDSVNWPVISIVNGESYVESRNFTFSINAPIAAAVNRLFLTDGTYVIAISSALPAGLQILNAPFTSKYRLYFR